MTGLDPSVSLCLSSSVHPAFVSFVPLSSRPEASSDDRRTEGDEGARYRGRRAKRRGTDTERTRMKITLYRGFFGSKFRQTRLARDKVLTVVSFLTSLVLPLRV